MPVFLLSDEIKFPSPELARSDGLLAVGGDLSRKRLLLAIYNITKNTVFFHIRYPQYC